MLHIKIKENILIPFIFRQFQSPLIFLVQNLSTYDRLSNILCQLHLHHCVLFYKHQSLSYSELGNVNSKF